MFVIIVGGGQIGTYLANLLMKEGHRVKLVEARQELSDRLKGELGEVVVLGSGTNPNLLEAAGIRNANVVAAVTGADETNLVVANLARFEFGVPRVIGRINNPRNAWLFTPEMGVDVALNQADLMGRMILEEMSLGDMMTLLKLRKGQYSLVEEKVDPQAVVVGKPVRDIPFPERSVLVSVIRKGELIIPRGNTVLQPADEILALVHTSQVKELARLLGPVR
jgi:trk system potassium uptake protein TrkA